MDKWVIDEESEEKAKASIARIDKALKKWGKFRSAVTENPFHHPKYRRIAKIASTSYPPGTYRYKDEPLRVVYYPQKKERIIYPLDAGTATTISYKKRSMQKSFWK